MTEAAIVEITLRTNRKDKMKSVKKMLMCLFLAMACATVFTGCQTAHGFGEDMENAGESIQKGTDK